MASTQYCFVHPFRTKHKYYIYDTNTNLIASVGKEIYDYLTDSKSVNHLQNGIVKAIADSREETGIFSECRPLGSCPFFHDNEIRHKIQHELKQVMLKVTDQCNLRCDYCIYNGHYSGRTGHANSMMPLDVARKAIDYLHAHCDGFNGPLALGFYGGEPLLNFCTIQGAIEYFRENTRNSNCFLGVTTNGTILNNKIIDFLVENNVFVAISIDGPEAVHDKNRLDTKGSPTFEKVMRNLNALHAVAPEYVRSMVQINVTLVPPTDFRALDAFFSDIPAKQFQVNLVELYGSKFRQSVESGAANQGYQEIKEKFIQAAISGALAENPKPSGLRFADSLFGKAMKKIHGRGVFDRLPEWHTPGGLCTPGADKILVAPDGGFYVCEKVDGNHNMKIGDVESGIDMEKVIHGIHRFYEFVGKDCLNCWLSRLCPMCYAHCVHDHRLDPLKRNHNCSLLRTQYGEMLSMYCEIMEKNPNAFVRM